MNKIATALVIGLAIGAVSMPRAADRAYKTCFVNAQELLKAHPQGKAVQDLRDAANKEVKPIADQLTALQTKIAGGTATAADRQQFDTLKKTYDATGKKWQDKIAKAIDPITKDVDVAVKKTSQRLSCAVTLDKSISASGLVVYADEDLDITKEVTKDLK